MEQWIPGFGLGIHPSLGVPFVCVSGTRGYYAHESHFAERWDSHRYSMRLDSLHRIPAPKGRHPCVTTSPPSTSPPRRAIGRRRRHLRCRADREGPRGRAHLLRGPRHLRPRGHRDDQGRAPASSLVVPRQNAHRDAYGHVNVEVPREGQMDLALALGPDDLYVARIHCHPGDAFHSAADDANPVISFEGGISIVVPFFGLGLRRGLDACAVYLLPRRVLDRAAGRTGPRPLDRRGGRIVNCPVEDPRLRLLGSQTAGGGVRSRRRQYCSRLDETEVVVRSSPRTPTMLPASPSPRS